MKRNRSQIISKTSLKEKNEAGSQGTTYVQQNAEEERPSLEAAGDAQNRSARANTVPLSNKFASLEVEEDSNDLAAEIRNGLVNPKSSNNAEISQNVLEEDSTNEPSTGTIPNEAYENSLKLILENS